MKNRIVISGLAGTILAFVLAVAPVSALTLNRELDIGAQGVDVSALQTFLAMDTTIYPEGLVTGYYGNLTAAAVSRWQTAHSIDAVGRVGPVTLAALNAAMGNVSLPPVGSPSTSDVYAPVMSTETVATSPTSATITWTTNEPARSRVMYSTVPPTLSADSFAAMPSVSDTSFDNSSTVTITGLLPNTRYYYVRESVDASGNLQYGIDRSFVTNP